MKVLLASAPHADTFGYSMPPPGLLRLGGALRRAGHDVALEDLAHRLASGALKTSDSLPAGAAALLAARGRPDLLGLSVMGATLPMALLIAGEIKQRWPDLPIVFGGPGVNGTDVRILERFDCVDAVARGEGERTIVELCAALDSPPTPPEPPFAQVAGMTCRGPGGVVRTPDRTLIQDLGELPEYAWDLLPSITAYKAVTGKEDGLVPIDSGRGCVYDCSFCSIGRTWGRRSRPLPVARLVQEVAALRGIPGARRAYLCHDIFGADRRHALAFCETLQEEGVKVPWEARARVDHLDAELLQHMGEAGCDRVLLGVESASPRVRRRNQKGMADDVDLIRAVDDCAAAGITPILSLILGLPGEEDEDLDASLKYCARAALRAGVNLSLHLVNPQPGCALGDEFGADARPVEGVAPDMALGAGTSDGERALIAAHPDLFSTWALLPCSPETLRELVFLSKDVPQTLMRYPRTFVALLALTRALPGAEARRFDTFGASTLGLARALRADGRSFETFARDHARAFDGEGRSLIEDLLAWEMTLVRVAARGPRRSLPSAWRLGAELLEVPRDLGTIGRRLSGALDMPAGDATDTLSAREDLPRTFAIVAANAGSDGSGELARVRTVALGAGAAKLARAVRDARDAPSQIRVTHALEHASTRGAADTLAELGVLVPPTGSQSLRTTLSPSR